MNIIKSGNKLVICGSIHSELHGRASIMISFGSGYEQTGSRLRGGVR